MTQIIATERPYYYATQQNNALAHTGVTDVGATTATALAVAYTVDINEHLSTLASWSDQFEPLPSAGAQLEAGEMYRHGDGVVIVRQSHIRTEHDPADVPALFLVAREPGTGIEWIAGEDVALGVQREHDGVLYQTLQPHVTQVGWEPPNVPALWQVVPDEAEPDEWQPGTVYALDEVRTYADLSYRCRQPHTSQIGWEPPNVPALWELVS